MFYQEMYKINSLEIHYYSVHKKNISRNWTLQTVETADEVTVKKSKLKTNKKKIIKRSVRRQHAWNEEDTDLNRMRLWGIQTKVI